ncbi:MAG TPA: hypothetical protein VFC00_02630 [Micromonosporaceae bacterium]|nr:hypothetical protein [Micromonosporaceae bacterium]
MSVDLSKVNHLSDLVKVVADLERRVTALEQPAPVKATTAKTAK